MSENLQVKFNTDPAKKIWLKWRGKLREEALNLNMPRSSPKMEKIYSALIKGWPDTQINRSDYYIYDVLWGLIGRNAQIASSNQADFIFCDMPYNGRYDPNNEDWDNTYWRWCYKGLHDGRRLNVPSDRFDKWDIKIKPWTNNGEYILLCPSSETMTQFMHKCSVERWLEVTTNEIKKHTNKPIKVRLKPRKNGTSGPSVATIPIEKELENAHAVVVSASLTAIDSLINGVPVFSTHHYSPASWVSNWHLENIDNPIKGDREQLFYNLAYKQYSIKEMREGICYDNSMQYLHY